MIGALVVGAVLALAAVAFVVQPLFSRSPRSTKSSPPAPGPIAEDSSAIVALREIEFDRATGTLTETDYEQLKAQYTREAVLETRRRQGTVEPPAAVSDAEVEAAVQAYRQSRLACPDCGVRPEADAVYCSNCGRHLRDRCAKCGAPVSAADARFCINCGSRLVT
jgi:DNA-directed RNA polymerase subunit RPC12/RpoP